MGIVGIGSIVMSRAEQRVEIAAQNLANIATPGYKSRIQFASVLNDATSDEAAGASLVDFTSGALRTTGNPLDLAIAGNGFFVVRSAGGSVAYTRDGQFRRDAGGRLVAQDGSAVQSSSGDIVMGSGAIRVLADGTVLENDEPVARIQVVDCADKREFRAMGAGMFAAPEAQMQPASAQIRQGALEASNVSTANEMISIMAGLRSAQAGQNIVRIYDDLLGRVVSALSQS